MLQILSRGVAALTLAVAVAVAVAASSAAQAHHRHHHVAHAAWPRTDYLLYSYGYHPILGFSRYGNCYWVEDFAPDRPHLIRTCPTP